MLSRTWDETTPLDTGLMGDGAEEIRNLKVDIAERLELDHNMSGELDPAKADADGRHKKVTLTILDDDPPAITDAAILYMKSDGLYYRTTSGIYKI